MMQLRSCGILNERETLAAWDDHYHVPVKNGHDRSVLQVGINYIFALALKALPHPSIWFAGEPGIGKTHLSKILGVLYVMHVGGTAYYCNWKNKLRQMQEAMDYNHEGPRPTLEREKAADLLILDDLGAERVTLWTLEQLYDVVNTRYEHQLPTIFTSNHQLSQYYEGRPRPTPEDPTKKEVLGYRPYYALLYYSTRRTDDPNDVKVQAERIRDRLKIEGGGMLSCQVFFDSKNGSHR
jgi:hypothetical protein